MDNQIFIRKQGTTIRVQLYTNTADKALIDEEVFPLDIHFDTVLVTSIDKILKRNRIEKVSPLTVALEGFEDESSMSSLIAKTIAEALKIR